MRKFFSFWGSAALATVLAGCAGSGNSNNGTGVPGNFAQTNLVADTAGHAKTTDPHLVNAWGIAFSPSGPFWVADNGTGLVTTYNSSGATQALTVAIPAAGGGSNGPVSGMVFNPTPDFAIPGGGASHFIMVNEDGIVSAWSSGGSTVKVADRSGVGAVYKGAAIGNSAGSNFLFATDFHNNRVDVFDHTFTYVKSFTDSTVPSSFAPFGIRNINGALYVTFAMQRAPDNHDDQAGPGNGFVDVFNTDGTLMKRLISQGALNSPWGLEQVPSGFGGGMDGELLVGNFGDGKINAYNIATGALIGPLLNTSAKPLVLPGLWGITFGNGGSAGSRTALFATSGPNDEGSGLFVGLTPTF